MKIAIDSSVLVGLLNPRDTWHQRALALRAAIQGADIELLYFDCVVGEAISVVARRLEEQGRTAEFVQLFERLRVQIPPTVITWIFPDVPRLYDAILDLIHTSAGALNFNDALIALACRERDVPAIASFDPDFDTVAWLRRFSQPQDMP
ncbi:MAG: type II toxin-antitoxin system VapC family toxin [Anaerolineae bacterium]